MTCTKNDFAVRKVEPFKNTIGVRSRGVRQGFGFMNAALEKDPFLAVSEKCEKVREKRKCERKCLSEKQLRATCDAQKKFLTPDSGGRECQLTRACERRPNDLSNGGPKRAMS